MSEEKDAEEGSKKSPDEKTVKNIVYIGKDDGFFSEIKKRFSKTYSNFSFAYKTIWMDESKSYQQAFCEILEFNPHVIYADFTKDTRLKYKLVNLLHRENTTSDKPLIGIVADKDHIFDSEISGAMLTFIKSGEYHDVIAHPMLIGDKENAVKSDFAEAVFQKETYLIDTFRVGYLTSELLHAEGNLSLEIEQEINADIEYPNEIITSNSYKVISKSSVNLYYDKKYSYDLEYKYLDQPTLSESIIENVEDIVQEILVKNKKDELINDLKDKEENKELSRPELESLIDTTQLQISTEERQSLINEKCDEILNRKLEEYEISLETVKKKYKKWIDDNTYFSNAKTTKILIEDEKLSVFKSVDLKSLDEYPYTFRVQKNIELNLDLISTFLPNIIALQYEPSSNQAELENDDGQESKLIKAKDLFKNKITNIIEKVEQLEEYQPFIFLFRYRKDDNMAKFDKHKILYSDQFLDLNFILKVAEKYQTKIQQENQKEVQTKYFLKKSNNLSFAKVKHKIKITKMTESECEVFSNIKLPNYQTFSMNFPCDIGVTFIPHIKGDEKTEDGFPHRGLIHSYSEEDKKNVRKFVNEIFFAELEEQRAQEKKEYEEKMKQAQASAPSEKSDNEDESNTEVKESKVDDKKD